MKIYHIIGLMSGSSLDGVDIALCKFKKEKTGWQYQILASDCIAYPERWQVRLKHLPNQSALTFVKTHTYLGHYYGELINNFIQKHQISVIIDAVASHGHTVFHIPAKRITSQIGDGAAIAATTKLTTVTNFRLQDVAAGGQGAPVAPIVDKYLFPQHQFCVNIGGIANISCETQNGQILGFDVCPANAVLNYWANKAGLAYDKNGQLAASATVNKKLLQDLNQLDFYAQPYPKSLGNEYGYQTLIPLMESYASLSIAEQLASMAQHIAQQIAKSVQQISQQEQLVINKQASMLLSGGGAFNQYLVQQIRQYCHPLQVTCPDANTINYKEALLMAFMAVLRLQKQVNCLRSVTGATIDTVGGEVHYGKT